MIIAACGGTKAVMGNLHARHRTQLQSHNFLTRVYVSKKSIIFVLNELPTSLVIKKKNRFHGQWCKTHLGRLYINVCQILYLNILCHWQLQRMPLHILWGICA